jgi:hypothetical protein
MNYTPPAAQHTLAELVKVRNERVTLDGREEQLITLAHEQGAQWHEIGWALGRSPEGVRLRYQ